MLLISNLVDIYHLFLGNSVASVGVGRCLDPVGLCYQVAPKSYWPLCAWSAKQPHTSLAGMEASPAKVRSLFACSVLGCWDQMGRMEWNGLTQRLGMCKVWS